MPKTTAPPRPPHLSAGDLADLRQRVASVGTDFLTDHQLLTLLLTRGRVSAALQERIHRTLASLASLLQPEYEALVHEGFTESQAVEAQLLFELAKRLARLDVAPQSSGPPKRGQVVGEPHRSVVRISEIARYLAVAYWNPRQEILGVAFLDMRGRLIGDREIFRGVRNQAFMAPAPILRAAIHAGAAAIVLFHNHPSGDLTPSLDDVEATRWVAEAAEAVGIPLVDHLILGPSPRYVSLRDRGLVPLPDRREAARGAS